MSFFFPIIIRLYVYAAYVSASFHKLFDCGEKRANLKGVSEDAPFSIYKHLIIECYRISFIYQISSFLNLTKYSPLILFSSSSQDSPALAIFEASDSVITLLFFLSSLIVIFLATAFISA